MRYLCAAALAALLCGCASSRQAQNPRTQPDLGSELLKYELTFRPSDYDPRPDSSHETEAAIPPLEYAPAGDTAGLTPAELVAGFRVQLFSSREIDEAKAKKAEAEGQFPDEWFYLEYDPPTYKIRAGNFLSRFDADRFRKVLTDRGYEDAWVVPEKVYQHPPAPPPR